ncbi:MAG: nitronate monooxygenase family protein [Gammaproteobacteria bacterium]|nr:nitronate monooxygenase family protein [Gammaproteobacteria bacterium]
MGLPAVFENLSLPVVASPMFLVSGKELVMATCRSGIVGTFPALNQRTSEGFERWLEEISEGLDGATQTDGRPVAPYGVNLIVHKSNPRMQADLALCVKHKVPLIITSLGAVSELVEAVHSYGGLVFHDVTTTRHGEKAAEAGVDGLIAVCAGAGGHAGTLSPFALLPELRSFFDGTLLLSGCISSGNQIAAAQLLGADMAYMGSRFIATRESAATDENKQMVVAGQARDIIYTPAISGVPGNFLRPSLVKVGLDPDNLPAKESISFSKEVEPPESGAKAWKSIWSAGQGIGSVQDIPTTAEFCARLKAEYDSAVAGFCG